jgi:UDP-hydrolysing UDP-N-acetyl-D-glucosamine 2-epimerase
MSFDKLKILAFTSIRSEYDLMSGLYKRLSLDENVDLQIIVSGTHLVQALGDSASEIEKDGLNISYRIESLLSADNKASRIKSAAILQLACIDILSNEKPDLVIFAGDREDVLVYAVVCAFLDIPSVHFFGGDHAKDGHVDNPVRHATSKLASLHFVSTEEHKSRLLAIGEPKTRIFVIGSVALDKFLKEPIIGAREVLQSLGIDSVVVQKKIAVLIFHPVNSERECVHSYLQNMVSVLNNRGYHVCASMPNSDPGNRAIRETLVNLSRGSDVTVYENLSRSLFINLLRAADLIIGNSSAGLLEAPSIPLPAINVGERQKGRLASRNVVFCTGSAGAIERAVTRIESKSFKEELSNLANPYGDGHSVDRAYQLIKDLDLPSYTRKPEDPLEN